MYLGRNLGSARLTAGAMRPGAMYRVRFKTKFTFDRSVIRTRWPRFNKDPLMHAGNLVMRIARGSIRRRKGPSAPGTPPHSHASTPDSKYGRKRVNHRTGRTIGRTAPFKQIFSVPYRVLGATMSVIVGMVGYTRIDNPVPGLQEHGGTARRKVFINMGQRRKKSGQYGRNVIKFAPRMVNYPQRPFMEPALMRAMYRLPRLWFNSISKSAM